MQTLHHRAWLRTLTRKRYRIQPAAYFWVPYLLVMALLVVYAVAQFISDKGAA